MRNGSRKASCYKNQKVSNGQGCIIVTPLSSTLTHLPVNSMTTSGSTVPQLSTQVVINCILLKAVPKGVGKEDIHSTQR